MANLKFNGKEYDIDINSINTTEGTDDIHVLVHDLTKKQTLKFLNHGNITLISELLPQKEVEEKLKEEGLSTDDLSIVESNIKPNTLVLLREGYVISQDGTIEYGVDVKGRTKPARTMSMDDVRLMGIVESMSDLIYFNDITLEQANQLGYTTLERLRSDNKKLANENYCLYIINVQQVYQVNKD